ncbi:MAG: hypothetical protein KA170_05660 [Candidatus Promineofilum sp.]|jgi:hypothetical protein|nr:hypothetical protein [Promineifilum sp.]
MFPVTSRYYSVETARLTLPDGREIVYLRRRFPPRAAAVPLAEHLVTESDRLDNVTAVYLGDPEQFWRVCDANNALRPAEMEEDGRRIVIPAINGGAA